MSTRPSQHPPDLAREVDELVDECRSTCLWHQRADYHPTDNEARVRILEEILGHADRATFLRAAKLRQCLLATSSGAFPEIREIAPVPPSKVEPGR